MEESGGSGVMVGYPSGGEDSSSSSSSSPSASATHEDGTPGTASLSGPATGSPAGTTTTTTTTTAAAADPKKLRACEACRGLKVRCEPDPREGRPCKRCGKAGRPCVVTVPTRRRQRKTDSRVSELEKKIDALTASLQARTNSGSSSGGGGGGGGGLHLQDETTTTTTTTPPATATTTTGRLHGKGQEHRDWDVEVTPWDSNRPADQDSHFQQLITMAGRKRKAMEDADQQQQQQGEGSGRGARPQTHHGAATRKDIAAAAAAADDDDRRPSAAAASVGWPAYTSRAADGDVVERGLVPPALAARLLSRYNAQMVRHLPGVVFAPGTGVAELRAARPVLFLAVMAAAAGEDHALQRVLQRELMHVLAARVLVTGEKSLELVQALNVAVIWYWPPEYFEELKFYQLIHVAAVMAIDIGLGRRTNGRARAAASSSFSGAGGMGMGMGMGGMGGGGMGGGWGSFRGGGRAAAPPDPTSLEARRTWLTCYYLASNTAMSLHRPHLIRWTSFMADSMRVLETSPDAAPTDRYFCHLVWTHHLGEQIGAQLSMDDPDAVGAAGAGTGAGAGVDIADPRTQYALRALERDLERYRAGVPPERMHATLKIAFDLLNLYMHETVLHADHFGEPPSADDDDDDNSKNGPGVQQHQQQQQQRKQQPLSAQHINALTSCLAAINGIFTTFLGMDVESIRCLPVFNFVRVAYAVVVLMKMYFSAEPPPPPPSGASGESGASTTTTTGGPAGASWSGDFGAVFTRDSMRVRQHLDALLDKFRETAAGDRCRPASKFLVVLAMLRSWFVKQGSAPGSGGGGGGTESARQGAQATGGVGGGDASTGSTSQQQRQQSQPQQQQQYHPTMQTPTASTPLHLLSEVATGSDPTNPGAAPSPFGYYRSTAPAPVPSFFPDANGGASFATTSGNNSSSNGSSSSTGLYPPWIAEAMMSSSSSSAAAAVEGGGVSFDGSDFPTAMMGIGGGIEGFDGARAATTNDQFWTDMFQGIPDPNMFTF
ncbi:C6 transcription factor (War1) [Cordyceps javanica]|uniref:C6 transcription factor (War1) n=1 Tax=Cordyceps javanica TaxID=43265 RepID=A0A545V6D5_9HYPO|nr:C6 transcription factor (War1) [Cordyceps javanica]TQW08516.1 C6 transcription factor (War1) [Cordyceps javanica]